MCGPNRTTTGPCAWAGGINCRSRIAVHRGPPTSASQHETGSSCSEFCFSLAMCTLHSHGGSPAARKVPCCIQVARSNAIGTRRPNLNRLQVVPAHSYLVQTMLVCRFSVCLVNRPEPLHHSIPAMQTRPALRSSSANKAGTAFFKASQVHFASCAGAPSPNCLLPGSTFGAR